MYLHSLSTYMCMCVCVYVCMGTWCMCVWSPVSVSVCVSVCVHGVCVYGHMCVCLCVCLCVCVCVCTCTYMCTCVLDMPSACVALKLSAWVLHTTTSYLFRTYFSTFKGVILTSRPGDSGAVPIQNLLLLLLLLCVCVCVCVCLCVRACVRACRACVCVCVRAVAGAGGGEPAAAGWSGAAAAGGGRRSVEHEGGCGGAVGRGRRRAAVPTHLRAVGRASPVPSCRQAGLHTTSVRRVFAHWQHCTVALDDSFSLTGCGYNRSCKVPADGETLRNVSESCPELLTEHS